MAIARSVCIDVYLTTGEKVSLKSIPAFCLNPLATNPALYCSMDPSALYFTLKTHIESTMFCLFGGSTSSHVLQATRDLYSISNDSFYFDLSGDSNASANVLGSPITSSTQLHNASSTPHLFPVMKSYVSGAFLFHVE